ncbi:MAG: amphi-Trp domain-containing protein [Gemmatimonadales bacterium]
MPKRTPDRPTRRTSKKARDIERIINRRQFATKLRRLADSIDNDEPFRIQVAGERVTVPADAIISVEHERGRSDEEIELQFRWRRD